MDWSQQETDDIFINIKKRGIQQRHLHLKHHVFIVIQMFMINHLYLHYDQCKDGYLQSMNKTQCIKCEREFIENIHFIQP